MNGNDELESKDAPRGYARPDVRKFDLKKIVP
jgi:hypothetical protein